MKNTIAAAVLLSFGFVLGGITLSAGPVDAKALAKAVLPAGFVHVGTSDDGMLEKYHDYDDGVLCYVSPSIWKDYRGSTVSCVWIGVPTPAAN